MNTLIASLFSKPVIEILPPERSEKPGEAVKICLCCRKRRANAAMDDDGCGICDECLSP